MPKIADLPALDGLNGSETVVVEKDETTGRASFNAYLDAAPAVPAKQRPGGGPSHVFADRFGFHRAYVDQHGGIHAGGAALGPGGSAHRLSDGDDAIVLDLPGGGRLGVPGGLEFQPSDRDDFMSAWVDRFGFLNDIRLRGGQMRRTGGVSTRTVRRGDFVNAWMDRIGFLSNVQRRDGGLLGTASSGAIDYVAMNARALSMSALRRNVDTLELAQPTADWNVILTYGQSLSSGWEAWPALTTNTALTTSLALFMLGDADKPQSEDGPAWLPFGTAQLNPLKATVWKGGALLDAAAQATLSPGDGAVGEGPGIAAAITARKMWLAHLGVADDGRKWIHASCGVGGKTIEQLSYGAAPHLFARMIDVVARIKALADAQGKTARIIGINFLGNEYNATPAFGGSADRATYLALRQQLRADVQAHVCAILGQTERPAWIEYQMGGSYTSDDHDLGVQMAQLDLIDRNRTSHFGSQPSFAATDKGGHQDPNGSRWMGCLMGRALGHVLTRRRAYWPLTPFDAVRSGREVAISHLVPAPPIQWLGAWRWTGAAHEHTVWANKGFALIDAAGPVPISTVTIVQDTIVRIVAARDFNGQVQVRLGGAADFGGNHNLFDSDPVSLPLAYEYSAGSGQYPAANIAELVGKAYPGQSAAYAYQIPVPTL